MYCDKGFILFLQEQRSNEARGEQPLMRAKRGRDDLHEVQISQPKRARLEDIVQPTGETSVYHYPRPPNFNTKLGYQEQRQTHFLQPEQSLSFDNNNNNPLIKDHLSPFHHQPPATGTPLFGSDNVNMNRNPYRQQPVKFTHVPSSFSGLSMPNEGLYSQGGTSVPYDRQGELYLQGLTRHIESRTITYSDFPVQSLSLTPMDYPANASQRETDYSTSLIMSSYSGLSMHASCTRLGQATSVASHGDLASQGQIERQRIVGRSDFPIQNDRQRTMSISKG